MYVTDFETMMWGLEWESGVECWGGGVLGVVGLVASGSIDYVLERFGGGCMVEGEEGSDPGVQLNSSMTVPDAAMKPIPM